MCGIPTDTSLITADSERRAREKQATLIDLFNQHKAKRLDGTLNATADGPDLPREDDYEDGDWQAKEAQRPRLRDIAAECGDPLRIRVLQRPGETPPSPPQLYIAGLPGVILRDRAHPVFGYLIKLLKQMKDNLSADSDAPARMYIDDIISWLDGSECPNIVFFLLDGFYGCDKLDARCRGCVERGTPCIARGFVDEDGNGQVYHHCLMCDIQAGSNRCDLRVGGPDTRSTVTTFSSIYEAREAARIAGEAQEAVELAVAANPGTANIMQQLVHVKASEHVKVLDSGYKKPKRLSARDKNLQRQEQLRQENLARTNSTYQPPPSPAIRGPLWPQGIYRPQHALRAYYPIDESVNRKQRISPPTGHASYVQGRQILSIPRTALRLPRHWIMERLQRYGYEKACTSLFVIDESIVPRTGEAYPSVQKGEPGKRYGRQNKLLLTRVPDSLVPNTGDAPNARPGYGTRPPETPGGRGPSLPTPPATASTQGSLAHPPRSAGSASGSLKVPEAQPEPEPDSEESEQSSVEEPTDRKGKKPSKKVPSIKKPSKKKSKHPATADRSLSPEEPELGLQYRKRQPDEPWLPGFEGVGPAAPVPDSSIWRFMKRMHTQGKLDFKCLSTPYGAAVAVAALRRVPAYRPEADSTYPSDPELIMRKAHGMRTDAEDVDEPMEEAGEHDADHADPDNMDGDHPDPDRMDIEGAPGLPDAEAGVEEAKASVDGQRTLSIIKAEIRQRRAGEIEAIDEQYKKAIRQRDFGATKKSRTAADTAKATRDSEMSRIEASIQAEARNAFDAHMSRSSRADPQQRTQQPPTGLGSPIMLKTPQSNPTVPAVRPSRPSIPGEANIPGLFTVDNDQSGNRRGRGAHSGGARGAGGSSHSRR